MIYANDIFEIGPNGLGDTGPGPQFDTHAADALVSASVKYYNAVSAGDVPLATQALADWNALRANAGYAPLPPSTLDTVKSVASFNQMKITSAPAQARAAKAMGIPIPAEVQVALEGKTQVTPQAYTRVTSVTTPSIRTNIQPTVTPTVVSHPAQQAVTVNAASPTPQNEATPTVTNKMLETSLGDKISNALSSLVNTINPMNYVDTIGSNDPNREWISGLPNWATIGIGLVILGVASLATGEPSFSATPSRRRVRNPKAKAKAKGRKHVTHKWK